MLQAALISDSHGYLEEMIKVLVEIGLVDKNGKWIGGNTPLIHLGDLVDRGPKSVELYKYIRGLQDELGPEQIQILIGNHDIQYIGGPEGGREKKVHDALSDTIRADVLAGNLKMATSIKDGQGQDWLCVHGGLHPGHHKLNEMPIEELCHTLNQMGREGAQKGEFAPEIVGVGWQRSGYDMPFVVSTRIKEAPIPQKMKDHLLAKNNPLEALRQLEALGHVDPDVNIHGLREVMGIVENPGITWCDVNDDLLPNVEKARPQIVGHRQQSRIQLLRDKLWAVNVQYGDAQALVLNEDGYFQTSDLYRGGPGFFMEEPDSYSNAPIDLDAIRQKIKSGWELTETEQEHWDSYSQDL